MQYAQSSMMSWGVLPLMTNTLMNLHGSIQIACPIGKQSCRQCKPVCWTLLSNRRLLWLASAEQVCLMWVSNFAASADCMQQQQTACKLYATAIDRMQQQRKACNSTRLQCGSNIKCYAAATSNCLQQQQHACSSSQSMQYHQTACKTACSSNSK